jgi:predicted ester cyclase
MSEQNKAIVRRAIENFNNPATRNAYLDVYDANSVIHGYNLVGLESIKQFYKGLWAAFPDSRVTIEDVIAEGDKTAVRYTFSATHQGDFMGIPPTRRKVNVDGVTILRFANGKCVERWGQMDMLGLMQQLGVISPPGQVG